MTKEQFEAIFKEHCPYDSFESKSQILKGLNIIAKYLPNVDIGAAEHDQVWASCEIDELIAAGIIEEDAQRLWKLGWLISEDDGGLTHFA